MKKHVILSFQIGLFDVLIFLCHSISLFYPFDPRAVLASLPTKPNKSLLSYYTDEKEEDRRNHNIPGLNDMAAGTKLRTKLSLVHLGVFPPLTM